MIVLRLVVRLVRLPFDLVFLTIDVVRLLVYHAMGLFWALAGSERPPFAPCARSSVVEVDGVELSRCPLAAKYGNLFLARLICGGVGSAGEGTGIAVCGCENTLRSGVLRTLAAGLLVLVVWSIVLGGAGYMLVLRYGNPFSTAAAPAEAATGTDQPLTPEQRQEQARGWVLQGEADLQAGDAAGARVALRKATDLDGSSVAAFVALGRACAKLEYYGEAQRAYDQALKLSPGNLDALLENAALADETGSPQRALALATQAAALAPESFEAALALARAQRQTQDLESAARTAARLLQLRPDDARASQESAAVALAQDALDEAERAFRRSIALDPHLLEPRVGLARVLSQRGDVAGARQQLEALITEYPADSTPKTELAELQLRAGNTAEAVRLFGEISAAFPTRYPLRARYGELLGLSGRIDEAYGVLQALLKDNPGDATAHLVLADLFLRRGFTTLADDHVTQALAQRPGDVQAYRMRARIVEAQGNMEAAIRILRALLEVLPQDAEIHARLARCLERTGDLETAETEIGRAIRIRPDAAALHVQRGQLLVQAKRYEDAMAAYRTAIEREPRNVAALNNLALALLDAGRPAAEALELARQARDLAPGSPQVADTLAWCHFRAGNPQAAEPLSAEAERGLPDDATLRFHRGMILHALGRDEDAATALQAALRSGLPADLVGEAEAVLGQLKRP
jgi:tetratricopeptide (TPR) repeat protein